MDGAMNFLNEILEHKRIQLERAQENLPLDKMRQMAVCCARRKASTSGFASRRAQARRDFKSAISKKGGINLIAEMKKASPSRGIIRSEYEPRKIAKIYEENNAAAISVLTEDRYFKGGIEHITAAREAVSIPVLRKDFIISEYQIYESAVSNADAVLLIASIFDKGILKGLYNQARSLGMDVLVEVHNIADMEKALSIGAEIIGINNRDLTTFKIDLNTTLELAKDIPPDKIIVSESGIKGLEEIKILRTVGINAVLIGTAFMESDDIALRIKRVMGW